MCFIIILVHHFINFKTILLLKMSAKFYYFKVNVLLLLFVLATCDNTLGTDKPSKRLLGELLQVGFDFAQQGLNTAQEAVKFGINTGSNFLQLGLDEVGKLSNDASNPMNGCPFINDMNGIGLATPNTQSENDLKCLILKRIRLITKQIQQEKNAWMRSLLFKQLKVLKDKLDRIENNLPDESIGDANDDSDSESTIIKPINAI